MSQRLSRRAFLAASCSAAALAPRARAATLAQTHDDAIWQALVGAVAGPVALAPALRAALARDFAAKFGAAAQRALVARFGRHGVAAALEPQPEPYESQLRWIAGYLFTGSADPSDKTAPIANYAHALGWKSLAFAKAPGLCDGPEFGYWLHPWSPA